MEAHPELHDAIYLDLVRRATAALQTADELDLVDDLTRLQEGLVELWTRFGRRDVVQEFLQALRGCRRLTEVILEARILHPEHRAEDLVFFDALGAALGAVPEIGKIEVRHWRCVGAAQAAANVLRHLYQCKYLVWNLVSESESDGADDDLGVLQEALADKSNMDDLCLQHTRYHIPEEFGTDSETFGSLFTTFSGVLRLKELDLSGAIYDGNIRLALPLLQQPSLRVLYLSQHYRLTYDNAMLVCRVIGDLHIQRLTIECSDGLHCDPESGAVPPLTAVLRAPNLKTIYLQKMVLRSRSSSMAFAQALASSKLEDLHMTRVAWHEDASAAIARALCGPTLRTLLLTFRIDVDEAAPNFYEELRKHLRLCPQLRCLRVGYSLGNGTIRGSMEDFLASCSHCPELTRLWLPSVRVWTKRLEAALAECVSAHAKLQDLYLSIIRAPDEPLTAPALLTACERHSAIEDITLDHRSFWCRSFLADLDRILLRNKDSNKYRKHFEPLAKDTSVPGILVPALYKVQSKPHLLYLGVSCCSMHLLHSFSTVRDE